MLLLLLNLMLPLLCVATSPISSKDEDTSSCPAHWIDASLNGMGCLLFSNTERLTWESASVACQEAGSTLVEILNERQLDFVRSELFFLADVGVSGDWWTYGTDFGREDQWIWMSSLSAVADFVWHTGEPNGDTTQNCMWMGKGVEFMADDMQCDAEYFYICQKK